MGRDDNLFSRPFFYEEYFTMNILNLSIYIFTYLDMGCHHFLKIVRSIYKSFKSVLSAIHIFDRQDIIKYRIKI